MRSESSDEFSEAATVTPCWEGLIDPDNPFNWRTSKKYLFVLATCFMAFVLNTNGSSVTVTTVYLQEEFHIKEGLFPITYLIATSWSVGCAILPILIIPLMEPYPLRYGYAVNYALFLLCTIPQVFAQNFSTIVAARFFAGGFSGVVGNVGGGIICEMWNDSKDRGLPFAMLVLSNLSGATIGVPMGGALVQYLGWRWVFRFHMILFTACIPFILAVPMTKGTVALKNRANNERKTSQDTLVSRFSIDQTFLLRFKTAFARSTRMLFAEPVVIAFTLWSSFCFGTVFAFTQSISIVFAKNYGWPIFSRTLIFMAMAAGEVIAFAMCPFQNWLFESSAKYNEELPGKPVPEARLYLSVPGSFIGLTGGMFLFAWASSPELHWMIPTIGVVFIGLGIFTVAVGTMTYVTDVYERYATNACAALSFGQNFFAAVMPLAPRTVYAKLGMQWGCSLFGFTALALSFVPVILIAKGPRIREKSTFIR